MTIFGGWASEAERDAAVAAVERLKGWALLYSLWRVGKLRPRHLPRLEITP